MKTPTPRRTRRRPATTERGVALLMAVTTIAILAVVILEFSNTSRTHLNQGVNIRDEVRAQAVADTAVVIGTTCMGQIANSFKDLGTLGAFGGAIAKKLSVPRICNMLTSLLVSSRLDLPIAMLGTPSMELEGFQGLGVEKAELEEFELEAEATKIGIRGLACPRNQPYNCPTQKLLMPKMAALLCDPSVAASFESEQADGKKYTREEVLSNIIDWQDADDTRTYLGTADDGSFVAQADAGEGEDSYYRAVDLPYKSKDKALDSISELRLIRGIDDRLYEFLAPRISVHETGKVNGNHATAEVFAAVVRSQIKGLQLVERQFCGAGSSVVDNANLIERRLQAWGQAVVDARSQLHLQNLNRILSDDVLRGQARNIIVNPFTTLYQTARTLGMADSQAGTVEQQVALRYGGMTPEQVNIIATALDQNLPKQVNTFLTLERPSIYRLTAVGRSGNMTRRVMAMLEQKGNEVRTIYYREE